MKRVICTGEIITAQMWNEHIRCNDLLSRELQVASAKVAELEKPKTDVAGLAALAMAASATTVPITRRQLFGFLRKR